MVSQPLFSQVDSIWRGLLRLLGIGFYRQQHLSMAAFRSKQNAKLAPYTCGLATRGVKPIVTVSYRAARSTVDGCYRSVGRWRESPENPPSVSRFAEVPV
jgi:hypothetical protein